MATTSQQVDNLCSLAMFLGRFEIAAWNLDTCATIEKRFFLASRDRLDKTLTEHFNLLIHQTGPHVHVANMDHIVISKAEIVQVLDQCLAKIESHGLDFEKQAQDIVKSLKCWCKEYCPFLPDLNKIEATQMLATGGDLTPYEVAFMGSGNYVMFPNVNGWTEEHVAYMQKSSILTVIWPQVSNLRAKYLVLMRYTFFPSIIHEFTHCIQTATKQTDKISWSAEHDASRVALVLLQAMHDKYAMQSYFTLPGQLEEVTMHVLDRIFPVGVSFAEQTKYREWVDAFGLKPPTDDAFTAHNEARFVTSYYKYRITLEAHVNELVQNQSHALDMMKLCFENRTGDVYQVNLNIPKELHIDKTAIEWISK